MSLLYVIDFEYLDLPMTTKEFIAADKDGLVRGLWRAHGRDPKARDETIVLTPEHHRMLTARRLRPGVRCEGYRCCRC